MENKIYIDQNLGDIVTEDFRSAEIFKESGLDFCCGGNKTLSQACKEKDIDLQSIVEKLNELDVYSGKPVHNYKDWDLGFLSDYIINTHHKYVIKTLPDLVFYTDKIAKVHGDHHPELIRVADLFAQINTELNQHLRNEEEVLFPAIKSALKKADSENRSVILSEISRMTTEHEFAGSAMDEINRITTGYLLPKDACKTYQVSLELLRQFEDDLHVHVHLENNILYPKALKL
ncbi:MAG: iron-sulfur cluster repair di-iron protein [Bacteroidales bacterium]|nr:iron-sulfur cluster repair di-iron protein [Bacteroidales bacterium]MCB9012447.1 iron-sulfur cluster repair di-iron protein [Bacteroidales bacterium]